MKTTFMAKAVSQAQTNAARVDWVVLAATLLGLWAILVTSVGGVLNGFSLTFVEPISARTTGVTAQTP